jgi:hypothetical protein
MPKFDPRAHDGHSPPDEDGDPLADEGANPPGGRWPPTRTPLERPAQPPDSPDSPAAPLGASVEPTALATKLATSSASSPV